MLRLIGMVLSIALADSINPSTIAPGLYLAMGEESRRGLIQFTLGVLAVNFLGGAAIALGPGQALLALVPHPGDTARYVAETVAGVVTLIAAVMLWRGRERLSQRHLPAPRSDGRSALLLGITIGGVELPTALPYFAAIAAIVGSGFGPVDQLILLGIYNLAFALPLILMIATVMIAPERAASILGTTRDFLERHWPTLLAGLALVAGLFVTTLGVTGLASGRPGSVGRFSRRLRRLIPH